MPKRYTHVLNAYVTAEQREFLEKYAEENDIGLGKAARIAISKMMQSEGVVP